MPGNATTLFWVFFSLTLLGLAAAMVTGLRGPRRVHLVLGPACVVLLTLTIVEAERMTGNRSFPRDEMAIHLWFAKTAAALMLPVIVTGVVLWRTARWRRAHFWCVIAFLVMAVTASGTGIWVYSMSTPK
jgi:hypothetical protein